LGQLGVDLRARPHSVGRCWGPRFRRHCRPERAGACRRRTRSAPRRASSVPSSLAIRRSANRLPTVRLL